MYRIVFSDSAKKDYNYWVKLANRSILKKIEELLIDISEHPFTGTGRPEALKYELSGLWSRRINSEHRIVYKVNEDLIEVYILAVRHHYSKK